MTRAERIQPVAPPSELRAGTLLLLFLLVLAWHAALFTLLKPSSRPAPPRPYAMARPSVTALVRSGQNGPTLDATRAAWTPVLLSLPSSIGFSAPLGAPAPRSPPALDLPREERQFLSRSAVADVAAVGPNGFDHGLAAAATARLERLREPPQFLEPTQRLAPPDPEAVHLLFMQGARADEIQTRPWPDNLTARQSRAWEAVVQAWADEEGGFSEVLLESRTEDRDLNAALVQGVRAWTLQPGASTNWVRLRVRSFGAPQRPDNGVAP